MDLKIKPELNETNNVWNIGVTGEIDIYNSATVKDYLSNLIQEHPCDIRLDCHELDYIDSTGLGALVSVIKKVKQYNGNFYLINCKPNVLKVIRITNLDKVFILEGDEYAQ